MGVGKGEHFATRDVYIDYPFEQVMYRWDHVAHRAYVKFYGKQESPTPIAHENRLFNDAILSGVEITREEYERGAGRG